MFLLSLIVCVLVAYWVSSVLEDQVAKARLPGRMHGDLKHVVETCRQQAAQLAKDNEVIEIDTLKITANDKFAEGVGTVSFLILLVVLMSILC